MKSLRYLVAFIILSLFSTKIDGRNRVYYPVLKSLSDCCNDAYLTGDLHKLAASLTKYQECLDTTTWMYDSDRSRYVGLNYKFISDLAYLSGDYHKAVTYMDTVLSFSRYFNLKEKANIFVEKAQSQFMLRDYAGASSSLSESCNCAYSTGIDTLISDCGSAYALSLAYCGDFEIAGEKMDEVISLVPAVSLDMRRRLERERRKAKIMILSAESKEYSSEADYKEAVNVYNAYFRQRKIEISSKFSTMSSSEREGFWLTQRQFIVDCYRLGEIAPELVYDVALFNKNLLLQFSAKNSKYKDYVWTDVRKGLPENGAAIEFIQYRRDSSLYLAAVVVTKNCNRPAFIHLGRIEDILGYKLLYGMTVREAIARDSYNAKNSLYDDSSTLASLIWTDDLQKTLNGCSDVYFSADGFLHQLAIENLNYDNPPVFHRLTSTRNVCNGCSPVTVEDYSALICGDMDFQARISSDGSASNDATAYINLAKRGFYFGNLEWSRSEIDSITAARSFTGDSLLTGKYATEQAFKELAGDFKLVHISSHGYFNGLLEVPVEDMTPHATDNTLSQSVIFFSGANANLHNSSFEPTGHNDGLVSARELSDMDLSNLTLCVLAACQTGLGDVTADGVYGIQRGLKNAGAGAMILSLWTVDDKATSILMGALYLHLSKGENVRTAFEHAREDLAEHTGMIRKFSPSKMAHKRVEKKGVYDKPYYRDAFILIDDIH